MPARTLSRSAVVVTALPASTPVDGSWSSQSFTHDDVPTAITANANALYMNVVFIVVIFYD